MVDHSRSTARAAGLLPVYLMLGDRRSLRRVSEIAAAMGMPHHIRTFERWATRFDWGEKAREFDAQRAATVGDAGLADIVTDDATLLREAGNLRRLGQTAVDLAAEGLADGDPVALMRAAPRAWDVGFKATRLLTGQSTSRAEVSVQLWQGLLETTGGIFTEHTAWAVETMQRDPSKIAETMQQFLDRLGAALDRTGVEMLSAAGATVEVVDVAS